MKNKDLLLKTADAFNASVLLKILRQKIRDSREEKNRDSISTRLEFDDKVIDEISEIVFEYIPFNNQFWYSFVSKILSDMKKYDFINQPSINRYAYVVSPYFVDINEQKIEACVKVSLAKHTLNLVKLFDQEFSQYEYVKSHEPLKVILSCLLHDFGKSEKLLKERFNTTPKECKYSHEEMSGRYISKIMEEIKESLILVYGDINEEYILAKNTVDEIRKAVKSHHLKKVDEKSLVNVLKEIDHTVRTNEWLNYKKGLKDGK